MKCAALLFFFVQFFCNGKLLNAETQTASQTYAKPDDRAFSALSRTNQTFSVEGKTISYEAIGGTLNLTDEDTELASLFFTAYLKNDTDENRVKRPLSFCFNGGPGSSSIWLHMGLLGPKMALCDDPNFTKPPSTYANNPFSLLDVCDLVFIDPVSTGFSKSAKMQSPRSFHGIEQDIAAFAEFIRLFLTYFHRWDSPRFLIGESYGTIRAVGLAEKMHENYFIDFNGLVLISLCLDFQAYDFGNGNDLPHILVLPSYTATAWYHKRLKHELQNKPLDQLLDEVEHFALHEYATALILGNLLEEKKRQEVLKKLSEYTGLNVEYLNASRLRIINGSFFKELLRKEGKVISRFDGRYLGFDHNPLEEMTTADACYDAIVGPFTSAFQQYMWKDLKIERVSPYKVIGTEDVCIWDFSVDKMPAGLGYVHMSEKLSTAIEKNPYMKVFVANGYYDLATPYFASDYTLSHLNLCNKLQKNIQSHYYMGGHMMYLDQNIHAEMKKDLKAFIAEAINQKPYKKGLAPSESL